MDLVADQIDVTTQAAMALTVGCARCHDHKFDPIPTDDYYAMAGIFKSSESLYGGGGNSMGGAPVTDLYALGEVAKKEPDAKDDKQQQKEIQRRLGELKIELRKFKQKKNATSADAKLRNKLTQEFKALSGKVKRKGGGNRVAPKNAAMGVRDRPTIADSRVNLKGETRTLGDLVPRGFVQVVGAAEGIEIPKNQSGRLELARWLTSPQHPLTSRVMVNRIWLHLFGTGLVGTPDNFGIHGEVPRPSSIARFSGCSFHG